jgi:hypothetical protein
MYTEQTPKQLILPEGHESWLDLSTNKNGQILCPNFRENSKNGLETHVHVVSERPFSDIVREILELRKYVLHDVWSPDIQTRAVASREFYVDDKMARRKGWQEFQEILLHPVFFGEDNRTKKDSFSGYVELEGCSHIMHVHWKPYCNNGETLNIPNLNPQPVEGNNFKIGDYHVTVNKIHKDPLKTLLNAGFYFADFESSEDPNVDKTSTILTGLDRVLTIQCASSIDLNLIMRETNRYIIAVGGFEGDIILEPVLAYGRTKNNPVPPRSSVKIPRNIVGGAEV